jgi:hypothetical protein
MAAAAEKELGGVVRLYRPDGTRIGRLAVIALLTGAAAAAIAIPWLEKAVSEADGLWPGIGGGVFLTVSAIAFCVGVPGGLRFLNRRNDVIKVREGGLVFLRGDKVRPVAWADITRLADLGSDSSLAALLGRDVRCRIELKGQGRPLVITGFTRNASDLVRTVEQAVREGVRPSKSQDATTPRERVAAGKPNGKASAAELALGKVLETYRPDTVQLVLIFIIALLVGAGAMAITVPLIEACIDDGGLRPLRGRGPGLIIAADLVCLWALVTSGLRFARRETEMTVVREDGLVFRRGRTVRVVPWGEITEAVDIGMHNPIATMVGRDVYCRIKVNGGGRRLVITGFTRDADDLVRTIEQALRSR